VMLYGGDTTRIHATACGRPEAVDAKPVTCPASLIALTWL
jgi:hypothetical protein